MSVSRSSSSLLVRLILGIGAVLLGSLFIFYLLLSPELADLRQMALFLSATALMTLVAGQAAHRLGLLNRAPSLRWALFATYVLSSLLTFMNVWLTARLMFFDDHDLLLGTVLLLFAGGIAMTLGYFFSETLTSRIRKLSRTIRDIGKLGLGSRVEVEGQDEIAQLGQSFNGMLERLEQAERKQAEAEALRRDLISWVSHDLQTPLASIQAIVEALADGVVEEAGMRDRYLHTAKRDIESLSYLIDDLFELAQLDAGGVKLEIQPSSLTDLISDTIESFSALAAEREIALRGETGSGLDSVELDVARTGRVLSNLIGNALRHTPPGGQVQLRASRSGADVQIVVEDTGEGFSAEDMPYIFERFYRGEKSRSRRTGGSGLGLAIAKGLVEAHAGRIWADQVSEGGARFTIEMPVESRRTISVLHPSD